MKLIGTSLRAGVASGDRLHETRKGVPQGGPLSPLLSNILLDELDKELEGRSHRFARYADDFVILVKSCRAGERVMANQWFKVQGLLSIKDLWVNIHYPATAR